MDHDLESIIPDPENNWKFTFHNFLISWKYWKSDFSNFSYPGNTGKWIFFIFSYPGNTGNLFFLIFSYPGNTGGRLQGLCCAALDYFWNMFPGISGYPGNIGNMIFLDFWDFYKKDARRNFTQNGPIFMPRSLI